MGSLGSGKPAHPIPSPGRGWGVWSCRCCCRRSDATSLKLLHTSHDPRGCPTLKQEGNGVALAQLGSSAPALSIPLYPSMPPPSPDSHHPSGPGLALPLSPGCQVLSCEGEAPTARPKVCRPQAFLTASPSHPPRLPRLPFTGAALLAPGPGACAWVETASRWSYFFTFLGGRGGRFGKKAAGTRKAEGRSGFERSLVSTAPFCREWRAWQGN